MAIVKYSVDSFDELELIIFDHLEGSNSIEVCLGDILLF